MGLTAGALVLVGAIGLAACQPATFDAEGKASSVIKSSKQISFDLESKPICDGLAAPGALKGQRCAADLVTEVSGTFRDAGTNSAWPSGVSMSFEGTLAGTSDTGLAEGLGIPGSECLTGLAPTGTAGGRQIAGPPPAANAACYVGLVTYRSTNKRYPNTTPLGENIAECLTSVASVAGTSQPMQRLDYKSRKELTGLAFVVLYDSDRNAKANNGDLLFLATLCGPYANQTAKVNVLDGSTNYGYATCAGSTFGGPVGGVFPSGLDGLELLLAAASNANCLQPITKGNIKVKLVPTTTTVPVIESTTTFQETTTTFQETTTTFLESTTTFQETTTTAP